MTDESGKRAAPYLPFSTFQTALDVLKQGLPHELHASVFTTFSGAARSQTMTAFRFLDLISEGDRPTEELEALVGGASESEQKELLRRVLADAYPGVVTLAEQNGAVQALREEIGRHGVQGDTARKAVAFFMRAAEWSGLPVSPHWKAATKRGPRRTGGSGGRRRAPSKPKQDDPAPLTTTGSTRTITLGSGATVALVISCDVLLLPPDERTWVNKLVDELDLYETEEAPAADRDEDFEFEDDEEGVA